MFLIDPVNVFSHICSSVVKYTFLTFLYTLFLLYSTTKLEPEASNISVFRSVLSSPWAWGSVVVKALRY